MSVYGEKKEELGFVSIIIPCRNEEVFIRHCLDSVIDNDYPKDLLEVLVVDGMSEDRTREILETYASQYTFIRLLDNPKLFQAAALNIGISHAKGQIIMRMDAHSRYDSKYITKCVSALDEYGADNVGGTWRIIPRTDSFVGKAIVKSLSHRFGVGNAHYRFGDLKGPIWVNTGSFFCIRRQWIEKIGPFNERVGPSEDMEFTKRFLKAGGRILLVPGIESHYYARSDMKSFIKHNWRNGVWAIVPFLYSEVMPIAWRHLVPMAFVLGLLGSAVLAFTWSVGLWILFGIVGAYTVANITASAQVAVRERDIRYLFVMPMVFIILHLSYGLGSLWGLVKVVAHILFRLGHTTERGKAAWLKRLFDLVFSSLALVILFPLFLIIALSIKLHSQGPVFYRGVRVGRFGKTFRIFKFRTMVANAEKLGGSSTADDDPRITWVGKFLRKYKLDELPQLINVLKGDMSLVGPRPEVEHYVNMFTEEEKAILSVRPGITDWASLWNSDEGAILAASPDPEKTYLEKIRPEKVRLQLEYVRRRSFWIDLKIIVQTVGIVLGRAFGRSSNRLKERQSIHG